MTREHLRAGRDLCGCEICAPGAKLRGWDWVQLRWCHSQALAEAYAVRSPTRRVCALVEALGEMFRVRGILRQPKGLDHG